MRYRIHYPDDSIYVGPSPASGYHFSLNGILVSTNDLSVISGELGVSGIEDSNVNNLVKNIYRAQSYYYNISQNIQPVGSYGTTGPLGYLRSSSSDIEFGFDYYINNFQNEYEFGLSINSDKSILSDIMSKTSDGVNFFIKTVQEGQESLHDMSNQDAGVLGFGNCFLQGYSFNYEVNSIPSASASFVCDNIIYTNSITGIRNPAIDPLTDTRYEGYLGIPTGKLYETTGSDYQISVVRNGDLTINIEEKKLQGLRLSDYNPSDSYSFLGQKIQDSAIQSFNVSLNLNRENVQRIGSKIPKSRDIVPPSYAEVTISSLCNSYNTGDYLDSLEENRIYDLSLSVKKPSCVPTGRETIMRYDFSQSYLSKKDYSLSLGANKLVNCTFVAPLFDDSRSYKGVSFSGIHEEDFSVNNYTYLQGIAWNSQSSRYEVADFDNVAVSSGLEGYIVTSSDFFSASTSSNGTGWETLTGISANILNVRNDSPYDISVRKNTGNMVSKNLAPNEIYSIKGISNLNEIDIRRKDQSSSVLNFIWEWQKY